MADEKDILKTIQEADAECSEAFKILYDEMEEDLKFAAGGNGQWTEADINAISSTHNIQISINIIKKQVDTLIGRREQTLTDLKAHPVEYDDEIISDISTRLLKWTLDVANAQLPISQAYKNLVISGLGWLFIDMDEERFIRLYSESPLNIYFDPYCRDLLGLSDCDYVIRYKQTTKRELKRVFPKKAKEIDELKDHDDTNYRYTEGSNKRKERIVVKEYWYRTDEPAPWIVNTEDPDDAEVWNGSKDDLTFFLTLNPNLASENRPTPVIKVATIVNDVLLQDEVYSYGSEYPFVPFVGYYSDSIEDWEYKIMGHVRNLKDIQRELNARHSAMMAVTQKTPLFTWLFEESSIKDVDALKNAGGKVGSIQYRKGASKPDMVSQQPLPQGEVQLLSMLSGDINQVGLAPEVTGAPGNIDSAKGISLMQATGLTSVAELNSHLNFALRKLGLYVLRLIIKQYPKTRMQRIVGNRLMIDDATWSSLKDDLRFNIVVDETTHSTTSQIAAFESLVQQVQHGVPVPPQTLIDQNPYLTAEIKQQISAQQQQQVEQQQQMQQAQIMAQLPKGQ